uniref:Uncharacterized protein n=1 Tax=Avena sativa TaxID=4498 RepID=A0ACD5WG50_AVESA
MSASPEFFQPSPSPAPDYATRLSVAADQDDDHDAYYYCHTPTGADISYLRKPATCPPAPIKPRPPSACRKRLFATAADIVALSFDDLEDIFRPDGKKQQQQPRRSARDNSDKPRSARDNSVAAFAN